MSAVLTSEIVKQKTGVQSLIDVKSLNCSCYGLQDVSIVEQLKNVEVLSLSLNRISSLRPFGQCPRLRELYLRKNEIADLSDIEFLRALPLEVLWLSENPVSEHPSYRLYVLQRLPRLVKLDNEVISDVEKSAAAAAGPISLEAVLSVSSKPLAALGIHLTPPRASVASPAPAAPAPTTSAPADPTAAPQTGEGAGPVVPMPSPARPPSGPSAFQHPEVTFAPPAPPPTVALVSPSGAHPRGVGTPSPSTTPNAAAARSTAAAGLSRLSGNAVPAAAHGHPQRASSSEPSGARVGSSSPNVLYAIMALLRELDEEGLKIVRSECEARLGVMDLAAAVPAEREGGGGHGPAGSNLVSPRQ